MRSSPATCSRSGRRLPVAEALATDLTIRKEMGIGHKDFFRILPRALGSNDYSVDGSRIRFGDETRHLQIELSPEGSRTIALLTLPVTHVTLVFHGYSEADSKAALHRFDLYYRRGGG